MADSIISAIGTGTSSATEGGYAYASYSLSSALGIATTVRVTVSGLGGATGADYRASSFQYSMGNLIGDWQTATSGGLITLNAGFTDFQLRVLVETDTISEANEALAFSVAQTNASVGLADSWWVPFTANLADPAGQGASAKLRTITAVSDATPVNEPISGGALNANHAAIATYNVPIPSGPGIAGDSEVRVSYYGLGGATGADYDGLAYNIGAGWVTIANNGLMTIPANATTFQLSANVLQDTLSESNEAISFNVSQTTASIGLVDSWWVPNTVNLADPTGQGATANLRIIEAAATSTAIEASSAGNNTNHAAVATYNVNPFSGAGSNAASVVQVSYYGLGGATGADYNGFAWKTGTADWTSVANNGSITIPASANSFQLSVNVLWDGIPESGEAITFNVARTTASVGLADSWSVPSTVNMADSDPTNHVFTSVTGRDHFFDSGFADIFVIPTGTSVANNGGTTGVFAGDSNPNFFGTDYDTITSFAHLQDRIDLPSGVTVGTVRTGTLLGAVSSEEILLDQLANPAPLLLSHSSIFTNLTPTADAVLYTIGTNSFLLIDSALNGVWDPSSDVLIKFVGTPTLTAADFI